MPKDRIKGLKDVNEVWGLYLDVKQAIHKLAEGMHMSTAVERDEVHKLLTGDLSVLPRDSMRAPKWPSSPEDSKRRQQIQQNGNDGAVYQAGS